MSGAKPGALHFPTGGKASVNVFTRGEDGLPPGRHCRGNEKASLTQQLGASHYLDCQSDNTAGQRRKLAAPKCVIATLTHSAAISEGASRTKPCYGILQILTAPSRPPEPSKLPSWLNETV